MSQVVLGTNYTYTDIDPQCNVGYGNVICGNCLLGYYAAVADQCTKCLNTKGEEVQTKMVSTVERFLVGQRGVSWWWGEVVLHV